MTRPQLKVRRVIASRVRVTNTVIPAVGLMDQHAIVCQDTHSVPGSNNNALVLLHQATGDPIQVFLISLARIVLGLG